MIVVTGRIIDETGAERLGLTVEARGDWLLTTERLAHVEINAAGGFRLEVPEILGIDDLPMTFRLRVFDVTGRLVAPERELSGKVTSHSLGDLKVHSADVEGLLVTQLTGSPKFVSEGNAIKLLVDGNEAFARVADDVKAAQNSVNVSQLFFGLPEDYERDAKDEHQSLVFKFLNAPLVPRNPQDANAPVRLGDDRPERLLLDKARAGCNIRILLNEPSVGWPEGALLLGVLTPLAAGFGAYLVGPILALMGIGIAFLPLAFGLFILAVIKIARILDNATHVDETKRYFGHAIADAAPARLKIDVRGFREPLPHNGVQHSKLVITDERKAVVLGSPFSQRYFDFFWHRIEDPHRGSTTSEMVHDLSLAVVGPAVHDLYEAFRLYWNEDLDPADKLPSPAKAPDVETSGEDAISKVQVVRTLSRKRFTELGDKSEKGILEGYLRAFAAAKHYIYLENQYFTDSVIADALIAVLKKNTNLELILVVPINPDVLLYPFKQAWQISRLRKAGGDRVGVFTRWSYAENHARPWVAPVYIHAKGAVVDDSWATVGSANLDGLSLDYNLLLSPLVFGETTASELNVNILPPTTGSPTKFAELTRRRLFAEHLGLFDAKGNPNPNDPALNHGPAHKWLAQLWRPSAQRALEHVKTAKRTALPGFILEYPQEYGGWLDNPCRHLAALGVELKPTQAVVRPIGKTRRFDFFTGKWDKVPELEDIHQ